MPNGSLPPWEKVHSQVLPVEYEAAGEAAIRLLKDHSPDVLLLLGVKSSGSEIFLERFALNVNDCPLPDAAGEVREGRPIRVGATDALQTKFNLIALRKAMAARDYPVEISNHAGAYLCNHVYFRSLDYSAAAMPATRVLFVHVPMPAVLLDRDATARGSLGYMVEAMRELIGALGSI